MEDSDFSKKKHADARTFPFGYFRSKFRKQGFDVCPFDPAGCGVTKYPAQSGLVFAFHVLMILLFDIMSR